MKNLVPTGRHGHSWEPDAIVPKDIMEADAIVPKDIMEADAFIHVGTDFHPLADRAIQTLKGDDIDTQLISVRKGEELESLAVCLDPDEQAVGVRSQARLQLRRIDTRIRPSVRQRG